jgi:tRNA1(Val) A37 N6-methylase TrmN6
LIKAFDVLNEYYAKYDKDYSQTQLDFNTGLSFTSKVKILKNNIFGVDLDKQAVDIAQLNLLLKIAEKGQRLPLLQENIKCGNSLIDDPAIAGDKAFKWEEEFKEVMKKGGFDVVVGNPPWVSIKGKQKSIDLSDKELDYLLQKYRCDTYRPNLFEMFIWRGLSLVKEGGYFGFIVPDRLCYNGQFTNIRKYILENFTLKKLWFKPIFEEVISDNVIFIIKKEKPTLKSNVEVAEYPSNEFRKIPQKVYSNLSDFSWFIVDEKILNIFDRIKNKDECFELSKKFQTNVGFIAKSNKLTKNQQNSKQIKVFKGENITRFGVKGGYYFEFRKENLAGGTQDINKLSKKNKVFLRKTGIDVIATFDNSGTYPEQSVYFVYTEDDKNESELKSICVLLNSKLLNCYYKNFAVTNRDATPQLKKVDLDKFPIILPTNLNPLIELADKMLSLNKRLNDIGENKTDERS